MHFRPVFFALGILLIILSVMMIPPTLIDLIDKNLDWRAFAGAQIFTAFIGLLLTFSTHQKDLTIRMREAFILTNLSWLVIAAFGALPLLFADLNLSFTDAFFESMSGITTTGSTILTGLDDMPRGILLWRSILEWLGGIGILVMALAVLPLLHVGGMQLFKTESMDVEKVLPSAAQIAASIGLIYLMLTAICAAAYSIAGMSRFDALNHAMTTIATGGFSTHDKSVGYFDSALIDYLGTFFMLLSSLPFVLYLRALRGNVGALFQDRQVIWFLSILGTAILAIAAHLVIAGDKSIAEAIRYASFNTVSVMTGTGYATTDYSVWGVFCVGLFFFLMCVGGCAGSTTCGIKIFRFQVLYEVSKVQITKLVKPHASIRPHYNGQPVSSDVQMSVMAFFFLFALSFSFIVIALSFTGLDYLTAMSGAVTAISNVGPGLGNIIGPAGTFGGLPDSAKWILSSGMLLGRLELFTFLVMLSPHFWRR